MALSRKQWLTWSIVAIAIVAGAMFVGDVRKLGARLEHFHWRAFAAALALSSVNYAVRFVRWQLYLRRVGADVPFAPSAWVFASGLSLAITPGKLGELLKSYLLQQWRGIAIETTAPIVIAERVTDLVALLALAIVGVAVYGIAPVLVASAAAVIGVGLLALAWQAPTRWLITRVMGHTKLAPLRAKVFAMLDGLAALCRPAPLGAATALAVPAWLCECVGFWGIANGFSGAALGLGVAIVIYAGTTIAGALSFLPGGLGVTEASMVVLLTKWGTGMDPATALATTLVIRFATLWFGVLLGLAALAVTRRKLPASAAA